MTALVWLRDDLRLADNPALHAAAASRRPVAALYCLDFLSPGVRPLGGAARWWLAGSLERLAADLGRHGVPLILRRGPAAAVVADVAAALEATEIHWNRRYDAAGIAIDAELKAAFSARGVRAVSHHANLLHEPFAIRTGEGRPYRVFTPFWRACLAGDPPRRPLPVPTFVPFAGPPPPSDRLADWALRPTKPDWAAGLAATWTPGEAAAGARLAAFVETGLAGYAERRDRPADAATSRLSPHLRFGEISPFQVWHAVAGMQTPDAEKFCAELGWREFCWHLTHHFPHIAAGNFNPRSDAFPWRDDPAGLAAWTKGQIGIPLVDAGMRQLWTTGWMHNRVRMVAASFLVKHLLIPWQAGERWFWDTLVDADLASNPANWQWVAGSGADAAPYFRVFNPAGQGEKFDPDGAYVRAHVGELAHLAAGDIHRPWRLAAPPPGYPPPLVDLDAGRERALAAHAAMNRAAAETDFSR
jgi:deoxyribodipyrimidine photo-lyase